jgi:transcriptional regulator with XRE-family HTH domain
MQAMNDQYGSGEMALKYELDAAPELREKLGRRLGEIRREKKISQEVVAKQIGMSRPHLSNVELGRSRAGWAGLRAMVEFYELKMETVVREVKSLPNPEPIPPQRARSGSLVPEIGSNFTNRERAVLKAWRRLSEDQQVTVLTLLLEMVAERGRLTA